MINTDQDPYYGKFALPGVGKGISQDRTRTLTAQIGIVQKAKRGEIFALFDGIGSKGQGGSDAAEKMCDVTVDFFRKTDTVPATADGLIQLLMQGNMEIYSWGLDPATKNPKGGCVGTVLWIINENVHVFHVGDTAAFCVAGEKTTRLTSRHCNQEGLLTSFFGQGHSLQLDVRNFQLNQCDYLVILSDGIADFCSEDDIFKTAHYLDLHQAPREFVRLAQSRESHDDLTAIVIDIGEMI
jgi:PPM family protein phosphatase